MSQSSYQFLQQKGSSYGVEVYRPGQTQLHFLVNDSDSLIRFCAELREIGCYLVTGIANDECGLEDHCFKIYYLFSHPVENVFVTLEYSLQSGREVYPSISQFFPAVLVFEREIADLHGLLPDLPMPSSHQRASLLDNYPEELHPLRRDWSQALFQNTLKANPPARYIPDDLPLFDHLGEGELCLPVGPIHAGVIEPGVFMFRISGEAVEQMEFHLGYTHKGIEHLFQNNFTIKDGWRLAEKVSGDSSFSHSLAYCKAVEYLARGHVPDEAHLLRAVLLELERIVNHIGDCSDLAQDIALEVPASAISILRENLMRLAARLTGSRFFRGVNRPGGICLPQPLDKREVLSIVMETAHRFVEQVRMLILRSDFRDRTINIGVLSYESAVHFGVTGLAARASGVPRDFRIQHPFGPYCTAEAQNLLRNSAAQVELPLNHPLPVTGDVFSRFIQRVVEVDQSAKLVSYFLGQWSNPKSTTFLETLDLKQVPNFETGLGYTEGWRGDIVYWVMKDKFERIYRCKVRDPSLLNWPGLKEAVKPVKPVMEGNRTETNLGDFPVINKSFNLSYSGADL